MLMLTEVKNKAVTQQETRVVCAHDGMVLAFVMQVDIKIGILCRF